MLSWQAGVRSGMQEGLDGAAFVHGPVAFRGFGQRQLEVEDSARVDLPAHDEVNQVGQEAADRGGAAVQVNVGEEQLLAGQLHVVGDADVADFTGGVYVNLVETPDEPSRLAHLAGSQAGVPPPSATPKQGNPDRIGWAKAVRMPA
jgi:hypothetical protein